MSDIKALDELRKLASNRRQDWEKPIFAQSEYKKIEEALNEIEREIDSRYMLLPVDADGVPIHVGDEMFGDCPSGKHVSGCVSYIGENRFMLGNVQFCLRGDYMHHVKPRTVEDILCELEGLRGNGAMYEDVVTRAAILARELRELLGGDAS